MSISSISSLSIDTSMATMSKPVEGKGMQGGPPPPPKVEEFDSNGDETITAEELMSFSSSAADSGFAEILAQIAETVGEEGLSYGELHTQLEANKPPEPTQKGGMQGPPPSASTDEEEDSLTSVFQSFLDEYLPEMQTSLGFAYLS